MLAGMCLGTAYTFVDGDRLQVIENDRDQSSMQGHLLRNNVVLGAFVHIDPVEAAHEDRYGSVWDKASSLTGPAVADCEAAVATALDLDLTVLGLDDTH